jgi:DnaJ-class molecular chaperone
MSKSQNRQGIPTTGSRSRSPGDEASPESPQTAENTCRSCNGTGRIKGDPCPECDGSGKIIETVGDA